MKNYLPFPLAIFATLLLCFSAMAQTEEETEKESFKDRFAQGNILLEDRYYAIALPIWEDLLAEDSTNANVNYKVGLCYFNISVERKKALPFFQAAGENVAKNYDSFSHGEKKAPVDTYYYLGRTFHLNNYIDEAIKSFDTFKSEAGKKHFLLEDTDRQLEMCFVAKELIASPVDVNIINVSKNINTEFPEYSPVISLDENYMFFTSRRIRTDSSNSEYTEVADKLYFEDIYVAYRGAGGEWTNPELLNINRKDDHDATIGISPDGQTIFIYKDQNGNGQLYKSTLEDTLWSTPELLGSDINTREYETHVTVSADGQRLYFVSSRKGGFGGKDIYRCYRLPDGEWSTAQNLGPTINTPFDEDGPFIHPDDRTLYFSSNGHRTMGGYDIFYSKLGSDSSWTKPNNIGYPINTTDDDVFYITTPDGERAYYSSAREGGFGKTDIYLIERPKENVEVDLGGFALLKGFILIAKGMTLPPETEIIITDNKNGLLVGESRPNRRNGSFVFIIPAGKDYHIVYKFDENTYYEEDITVPPGTEYREIKREILLRPIYYGDTSKTEVIVLMDDVLSENIRYQLQLEDEDRELPLGLKMNYVDPQGKVVYSEYVSQEGYFRYHELGNDSLMLQLANEDDTPLARLRVDLLGAEKVTEEGDGTEAPKTTTLITTGEAENYTFREPTEAEIDDTGEIVMLPKGEKEPKEPTEPGETGVQPVVEADTADTNQNVAVARTVPPVNYERYFTYNKNRVNAAEKKWKEFVDGVALLIEVNGVANISVESSASKVPTATYKTNENLSDIRAKRARERLETDLKALGVDTSKLTFSNMLALVQGPEYRNDAVARKSVYEQFQYVRLRAR